MTETTKSGLPPLDQIREEATMRIITLNTAPFKRKQVETFMTVSNDGKTPLDVSWTLVGSGLKPGPLVATLLHLDDERIKGFMPSKVWSASHNMFGFGVEFNILYYINTTMPLAVKPFKDNTYLMYFIPRPGDVIEYDVNVRFFMDQILVPDVGMVYVVMFGDESYKDIVIKEIPDESKTTPAAGYTEPLTVKEPFSEKMEGWVKQALEWRVGDQK